jgi:hypothetical protein
MGSRLAPLAILLVSLIILPNLFLRAPAPVLSVGGGSVGTGLIVPLYGQYDLISGEWNQLIQAKAEYPAIPMIAIVNAANGPGQGDNLWYASAIQRLQAAKIIVLGYVWTSWSETYSGC